MERIESAYGLLDLVNLSPLGNVTYSLQPRQTDRFLFVKPQPGEYSPDLNVTLLVVMSRGTSTDVLRCDFGTVAVWYDTNDEESQICTIVIDQSDQWLSISVVNVGDGDVALFGVGTSDVSESQKKHMQLYDEGKARLAESEAFGNQSVSMVTVLGKRGTGKSTIASLLTGNPSMFETGTRSTGTTTRGIYASPRYDSADYARVMGRNLMDRFGNMTSSESLYILDTEGMGMFGREQDLLMLVPLALLSKTIMWVETDNIKPSDMLEELATFVDAVGRIHQDDGFAFDSLIFVLNKMQGRESDRQLQRALFGIERRRTNGFRERNEHRRQIQASFRNIQVFGLPYLQILPWPKTLTYSHFDGHNARFRTGLKKVVSSILQSSASPKVIDTLSLNGETVVPMLENVVQLSNDGDVYVSTLALRTELRLLFQEWLIELQSNVTSDSDGSLVTYAQRYQEVLMLFNEKLETKISSSPKNLVDFFVLEKADLIIKVASIMNRTLESYLDRTTSDVTYPTTSDCQSLDVSSMRCHFDDITNQLKQRFGDVIRLCQDFIPSLIDHFETRQRARLAGAHSLSACAVQRLQVAENASSCRQQLASTAEWNNGQTVDHRSRQVAECDTESLINVGEDCMSRDFSADIWIKTLDMRSTTRRSTLLYNQTNSAIPESNHFDRTFDIDNVIIIYHSTCNLIDVLKLNFANKEVTITCQEARVPRKNSPYLMLVNAASLVINTHHLVLHSDVSISFPKPPKAPVGRDGSRLGQRGYDGSLGQDGASFSLTAAHVHGEGVMTVDAPGGDGGDGGDGRDGQNGSMGADGKAAERKHYTEVSPKYPRCSSRCECTRRECDSVCGKALRIIRKSSRIASKVPILGEPVDLAIWYFDNIRGCCDVHTHYTHVEHTNGTSGLPGMSGQRGGDAGTGGRGGDTGRVMFQINDVRRSQFCTLSQPGRAGACGEPGYGGRNGRKGRDGSNTQCRYDYQVNYIYHNRKIPFPKHLWTRCYSIPRNSSNEHPGRADKGECSGAAVDGITREPVFEDYRDESNASGYMRLIATVRNAVSEVEHAIFHHGRSQAMTTAELQREMNTASCLQRLETQNKSDVSSWVSETTAAIDCKKQCLLSAFRLERELSCMKNEPMTYETDINLLTPADTLEQQFNIMRSEMHALVTSTPSTEIRRLVLDVLEYPDLFSALQHPPYRAQFSVSHRIDVEHRYWVNAAKLRLINVTSAGPTAILTRLMHPGTADDVIDMTIQSGYILEPMVFESSYVEVHDTVTWLLEPTAACSEEAVVKPDVHTLWQVEMPRDVSVDGIPANEELDWSGCQQIELQLELAYYD